MKETRRCSALLTSVLGLVLVAGLIRPQEIVAFLGGKGVELDKQLRALQAQLQVSMPLNATEPGAGGR